jgi:hypothetical protein
MSMAAVVKKRVTAEIEGDFVVFLIGMRINRLRRVRKWLPIFLAMLIPAAGRKATAAGRAGMREESYPEGTSAGSIEV